jgi:hypothetical protein
MHAETQVTVIADQTIDRSLRCCNHRPINFKFDLDRAQSPRGHAVADVADAVAEEEEGGGGGADAAAGHLAGGAVAAPGADAHLHAPPLLLTDR